MAFLLGDIYIGDYPVTQRFGDHPEVYNARFGLKGHNGEDIGVPMLTPILAAANGFVSEVGFDPDGYGNYIKIVHEGYLTLYGHLNDVTVALKDKVVSGQLIAHSDDSGFSDGPHLHFGVAPCDVAGNKTEQNNGYSGYIDPNGDRCHWEIMNLNEPVTASLPIPSEELMDNVTKSLYAQLVTKSTNWDNIAHDLNLADQDITSPDGATRVAIPKVQALRDQITSLNRQLTLARGQVVTTLPTDSTSPTIASTGGTGDAVTTSTSTTSTTSGVDLPIDPSTLPANASFITVLFQMLKGYILK